MKRILFLLLGFLCFGGLLLASGCRPLQAPPAHRAINQAEAEQIVQRLIDLGWLKYVPEGQHARVRSQLVASVLKGNLESDGDHRGVSADRRSYPADNEQLAKGSVGKCIALMQPVLEQEGVRLQEVEDLWHETKYHVVLNGEAYLIYDGKASDAERTSLERLLEIINDQLEEAGSDERLFAVAERRQGRVLLLTEALQEYVDSLGAVLNEASVPYSGEDVESAEEP